MKLSGNASNGANAGVTYTNLNNASSNDNVNISGQLSLCKMILKNIKTLPLGKTQITPLKVLVGKPKILRSISRLGKA